MTDRTKLDDFIRCLDEQIGPDAATPEERLRFKRLKSTNVPSPPVTLPSNN